MNSRYWMIGLLVIMAIICSAALALVNIKTSPIISKNEEISYKSTVLDVFGVPYDRENSDSVISTYDARITERKDEGLTLFDEKESGATAIYISGGGFQGPISLVVALDGSTITGLKIVSQSETPGLGARITEEEFQNSFKGKVVPKGISMTKSGNAGPGEFDGITGATETSKALVKILNKGLTQYFEISGKS
ncbi:MAG: RnfABCDGE type electron transport complex subunit G [Candidatus Latescibacteria bacterium]|nr:RnfABCDGE type electron transport complex subunit G [Candidatus Latescibacterota bacterium]